MTRESLNAYAIDQHSLVVGERDALRGEIEALQAKYRAAAESYGGLLGLLEQSGAELAAAHRVLKDLCEDAMGQECEATCTYAHAETCRVYSVLNEARARTAQIARLRAVLHDLVEHIKGVSPRVDGDLDVDHPTMLAARRALTPPDAPHSG